VSAPHPGARSTRGSSTTVLAWKTLRVRQWWHFLALPAVPLYAGVVENPWLAFRAFVPGAAVVFLCLGYAYGLNAVTDRFADHSSRKNPLAGTDAVPAAVRAAVIGSAFVALALAAVLGWIPLATTAICVVTSTVYSAGPRLKRFPVVSSLLNLGIFVPLMFVARIDLAGLESLPALAVTMGILLLQNQLIHEVGDREEDAGDGVRTTAVALGVRATRWMAAVAGIVGAALVGTTGRPCPVALAAALSILASAAFAVAAPEGRAALFRHWHRRAFLASSAVVYLLAVIGAR